MPRLASFGGVSSCQVDLRRGLLNPSRKTAIAMNQHRCFSTEHPYREGGHLHRNVRSDSSRRPPR